MAEIVLGFGSSHGPQLNMPADKWPLLVEKDQRDPRMDYEALLARNLPGIDAQITPDKMAERYDACHVALDTLRRTVAAVAPDVIVVIGDDQHEQFHDENMPMFSLYYGESLETVKRGEIRDRALASAWGQGAAWRQVEDETAPAREFPAAPDLARHLIRSFQDQGVDIAASNKLREEVGIGHAFSFLYRYITPEGNIPAIPFMVNTFFKPNQPTPQRCYQVGEALRRGIESWDSDKRVAVMASGGLSHVIIDEEIDHATIEALQKHDAQALCALPEDRLERGTSEIRNWIVLGAAVADRPMTLVDYQPCYRSPAGTGCAMGFAVWK